MKNLLLFMMLGIMTSLGAQDTIIYDFEGTNPGTFTHFGSSLDGNNLPIVDNPNTTGINTTSKVMEMIRPAGSETYAGAYANPTLPFDLGVTSGSKICVDAHFAHTGTLTMKLENSANGNWERTIANVSIGAWETICFELDSISTGDTPTPATGNVYPNLTIFQDLNEAPGEADTTIYLDNFVYVGELIEEEVVDSCIVVFDWESPETSENFKYFGSSLEADTAHAIPNPNPTEVNSSTTVIRYVKAAGSQTWAGAAPDANLASPIDFINGGEICVDVHFSKLGNIGLKLEGSSTGGPNWIRTVENTEVDTWQTLCIDVSQPGLEETMEPATGHIYNKLVIFPYFGTAFEENDTSYIDNLKYVTALEGGTNDVIFEVNMTDYPEEFTTVFISGEFNGWSADANPMSDPDGDGVWSVMLPLANGAYEYKFQVDGWAVQEQFDGSDVCTKSSVNEAGETNTNRLILISDDSPVGPVCWESCYDCGASVEITWNVNMVNEEVSEQGVYVAGGPFFGHAELPAMTDEDGDGIYTITLTREIGFVSDYTFLNGICLPDWNCKEQIAGQDCAVDPFNDRNIVAISDTIINTCFGECTTDGSCSPAAATYSALFRVDMTNETIGENGVFLTGPFVNWQGDQIPMSDEDANGIYEGIVELEEGVIEYKFVNSGIYEEFTEAGACTISTAEGNVNRVLLMEPKDTIVQAYTFNSCESLSSSVSNVMLDSELFTVKPTVSRDYITLTWKNTEARKISVMDLNGKLIEVINSPQYENEKVINVSDFAAGIYIIKMDTESSFGIEKFIVN